MLFVLFFLTDAQHWAEQYTSINRVFLQVIPALLFWVMTVFVPPDEAASERLPSIATQALASGEQPTV